MMMKNSQLLSQAHPEIYALLHPTLNLFADVEKLTAKSNRHMWWLGLCGHEWQARVFSKVTSKLGGCPYCSGRKALIGFNDLPTLQPGIAAQFHPTANGKTKAEELTLSSNKKIVWLCGKGHSWRTKVCARISHGKVTECPKCCNKEAILGETDIASQLAEFMHLWHGSKNSKSPVEVSIFSTKLWWWQCPLEHEWRASLKGFLAKSKHSTCPFCHDRQLLKGFNDLVTRNAILASEWNCNKNGSLRPDAFTPRSNQKVWWKCGKCSHEWQTTICSRAIDEKGCPKCCLRQTSKIEHFLREQLRVRFGDCYVSPDHLDRIIDDVKDMRRALKVDVIVKQTSGLTIAVEYDGYFWHKDKLAQDVAKTERILATGAVLIRIREQGRAGQHLPQLAIVNSNLHQLDFTYENASSESSFLLLDSLEALIRKLQAMPHTLTTTRN